MFMKIFHEISKYLVPATVNTLIIQHAVYLNDTQPTYRNHFLFVFEISRQCLLHVVICYTANLVTEDNDNFVYNY